MDFERKTEQELHDITILTFQNVIDMSGVLKELSMSAKNYLKTLQNVRQAATSFYDSLSKVSHMAGQSKGTARPLGPIIADLVVVKREVETRHSDVMKYLQNDLIAPLDIIGDSGVQEVKSLQKIYQQENKTKLELLEKAKAELLRVRKKSQRNKPTEKYEEKEKQCEQRLESCQKGLREFRLDGCRKAMKEEWNRYCFVLDRCSIASRITMEYCEQSAQILREKLPLWFSLIKKKENSVCKVNGSMLNAEIKKDGVTNEKIKLKANFAHTAAETSQLSFKEGDLINPISEVVSGWQYGENLKTNKSGWFPAAYTEEVIGVMTGPSVSHTLPASGVHLRPALDSSAGHKSLKRYSSAGPDALHYPPPDYVELDNKAEVNSLSSTNAPGLSGSNEKSSASMEVRSPLIPPPPPPLPPSFSALGKSEETKTKRLEVQFLSLTKIIAETMCFHMVLSLSCLCNF
ncbi:brain-specific angiogenesis inhibitor 1-associated protein 2-like protein 1 isoform X1 [Stylophora pistillata]|uniref:brain-specific angiogenesis inhibitor 1-associated protein 2-like protein 1 isoform X1 n=2 Tax=Stylophora pistillata TaxID=50429 RepID=UPI000C040481|nr:brain-specific angiogenesis inhibitor 1-associated protein 2-like protein 1 isoform X1 [Stylophora pistillata]